MSPWVLAVIALLPPFGLMVLMCSYGPVGRRIVAAQMVTSIGVLALVTMTFAFDEASSIDLALVLGLLCLPASLLYALFLERWL